MSSSAERRSAPRLQLVSPFVGHDDRGEDVTLVNISDGGLLVHTAQPASVGQTRHLKFQFDSGQMIDFTARVIHVLRISADGTQTFAVGLEFADAPTEDVRQAMRRIAVVPDQP
jgi:hypothetical protein